MSICKLKSKSYTAFYKLMVQNIKYMHTLYLWLYFYSSNRLYFLNNFRVIQHAHKKYIWGKLKLWHMAIKIKFLRNFFSIQTILQLLKNNNDKYRSYPYKNNRIQCLRSYKHNFTKIVIMANFLVIYQHFIYLHYI